VPTKPMLISFSGLDGSGKSSQIGQLRAALQAAGLRTRLLAFWDDVVVGVKYREGFVHKVYKSEPGTGAPGKPVNRRDKNVRGWHLTVARHFLYLADAVSLCRVVARERKHPGPKSAVQDDGARAAGAVDVIIFDRYIYDELSNLNLDNPLSRAFVRLVRRIVPQPDLAYLLDADPVLAQARKPEYPVHFMHQCRQSYFALAALLGTMTAIPPLELPEATQSVLKAAAQRLAATGRPVELLPESFRAA
jgi:thymidylate kinase